MSEINAEVTSVEAAWRQMVSQVVDCGNRVPPIGDPLSIGSNFGCAEKSSLELLGARIQISNPRARIVGSELRKPRLGYAIAHTIWALSGSESVSPLGFYNKRGYDFSDDGRTVLSALGHRIFAAKLGNQFDEAIKRINRDPNTRRALIQIYLPDDLFANSRDISCVGSLHLIAREGKLHAISQMRSQSVLMVFPYDAFVLTMLHEIAAVLTGREIGSYIHICNSAHIYQNEMDLAKKVAVEKDSGFAAMSPIDLDAVKEIPEVIEAERSIRETLEQDENAIISTDRFGLSNYWTRLLRILVAGWKTSRSASNTSGVSSTQIEYQNAVQMATKSWGVSHARV